MVIGCTPEDKGWIFTAEVRSHVFCRGCLSNEGGVYTDVDRTETRYIKVSLNDENKDTEWFLEILREPHLFGYNDRLYSRAINKTPIFVGDLYTYDRMSIDNRRGEETLITYDFLYCGEIFCCCCPPEMNLPRIIETKLK